MEQLLFGLSVTVIGMLVVFAGLVILIACIKGISVLAAKGRTKAPQAAAKAEAVKRVEAPPAASPAAQGVPAEVLAAITAAIAAVWQGETGFVVRHVKRVHNAPAWNRAGRDDQIYSRF